MSEAWSFPLGLFVGTVFVATVSANTRQRWRVPTVLGSPVPLATHIIDFTRRFNTQPTEGDRYGGTGSPREFPAARVVGYVGKEPHGAGGKFYEEWIVLEGPDGRKFYITPHSIRVLEELPATLTG